MGFAIVPDGAIAKLHELTPKAGILYVHYCKWRDAQTGQAFPSLSTIARDLGIPKSTACELRKQLTDSGWIELLSGDTVRVVMGFEPFGKPEQHSENPNDKSRTAFGKPEQHSEKSNAVRVSHSEKSNGDSEKSNDPFGKVESHIRNNKPMEQDHGTNPEEETTVEGEPSTSAKVKSIFEYWQIQLSHPRAKLTYDRRRRIVDRLRDGYSVEEIKQAIDGWPASPFHRGENPGGVIYDDIELICRNGSKLEKFMALSPKATNEAQVIRHPSSHPHRCPTCMDRGIIGTPNGSRECPDCSGGEGARISA